MAKLRLAVVTDIHYGFDIGNKLGSKAPRLLDQFAKAVNRYNPDCVVDMGDRISCRNRDVDLSHMKSVKEHFNAVTAPTHHMIGNHDAKFISRADNEAITGSSGQSYSRAYNGYHLVFWNPNVNIKDPQGLMLAPEDVQWLRDDLARARGPVILFSHVPLDNDQKDYDEEKAEYSGIAGRFYYHQGHEIRSILEESGKVVMCMAGHRHTKRHREINGIHYITQQSMTSGWNGTRKPMGTYAFVEMEGDKINIALQGRDRSKFALTARPVAA